LGKISKALDRYSRERIDSAPQQPQPRMVLTQPDYDALVNYDRFTGHIVSQVRLTGELDGTAIEKMRKDGTVQRLLDNELIYPGGKLTARGIDEAARLERMGIAARRVVETPSPPPRPPVPEVLIPPPAVDDEDDFIAAYEPAVHEPPKPAPQPVPETRLAAAAATPAPTPVVRKPVESTMPADAFKPPVSLPSTGGTQKAYDEARIDPNLVALHTPQSYEAEQFKILRTNILYPVAGQPPRSILVTSTAPGEGKTFTAANLAISIALNINRHVLLIDADLRRPQLNRRFGFGDIPGLSNYLDHGVPLPSLLVKTPVDKLTLLAGGPVPGNPSELISSERMANLIAEVTSRYADRLIVIDAPPPALTAETSVLARQVDGILVVVRHGKTRREELTDLVNRVGASKILGSVVNYLETSSSRYYGYKFGGNQKQKSN
jgi:protein-tyrosine kinase